MTNDSPAKSAEHPRLTVADVPAWCSWLEANDDSSDGVWLAQAKKGVNAPTSLTYADALEEALCSGWIDGQRKALGEQTFLQRFTPRRQRSLWSQRNITTSALSAAGRMRPRGLLEIDKAKADGRWDRAYAGPASAEVPTDLDDALNASPVARERFDELNRTGRYSVLHPVITAPNDSTRKDRIARAIARLEQQQ